MLADAHVAEAHLVVDLVAVIEVAEAMAVVTVVAEAVDTLVAVIEAEEATVATEMAVHVVDTLVVATEGVAKATAVHVVAIAALVVHADVLKVAADAEISNQINFITKKPRLNVWAFIFTENLIKVSTLLLIKMY